MLTLYKNQQHSSGRLAVRIISYNVSGYAMFAGGIIAPKEPTDGKYGRALATSIKISNGAKANRIARVMCCCGFASLQQFDHVY